ncbi:MAG: translation initiation factor IF-2 [Saprospiraceae bacterium]|jgi:translation initiation factor IF-2|nr:translation initiation factor IF-2 [Saprospiraceae bacterium]MBP9208705.1 translation initiation factor IF-2 [Saprospiraceae bacterium]MBV6472263.1 Elongation factor 4 [Saprospiraceae bacterium]
MKLLIKVASEFNVGLQTVVDALKGKGFDIEAKPTAKITDEMLEVLLKEFQRDIQEKEQADQLQKPVPGVAPKEKEKEKEKPKVAVNLFGEAPNVVEQPVKKEPELVTSAAPQEKLPGLKVIDKIPLESKEGAKGKKKPKKVAGEEEVEKPAAIEVVEEVIAKAPEQELTRIEAPKLTGIKQVGKMDLETLKRREESGRKPKPAAKAGTPGAADPSKPAGTTDDAAKKRKRKRKKVNTTEFQQDDRGARTGRRTDDAPKEITSKEIDDQIKQTMARLQGTKSKQRQKVRRDKREERREREGERERSESLEAIQLTEFVTVSELANLMEVPVTDIIMTCMNMGIIVSINQRLESDVIEILAEEFDKKVEFISEEEEFTDEDEEVEDDIADLVERAPIVTVMGHVDHGKTSLLDHIRKANVASGEAGGITQHIGAYEVFVGPDHRPITFLDTPGHEAFTAMRARGAKVTDIAVIIVAADDHVMPQTREAISHAQAAGVPMVFAINKVDKPGADPERIKNELSQMNLLVEEWGGKFQSQDISAKSGLGIDSLLEKILLEADVLGLKANPKRQATGTVIEASLDKGRGYLTKLLVQNGTLKNGDILLAGEYAGKVKAMFNERAQKITKAPPSTPVLVLGLHGAPTAGEKFKVMEDESEARLIAGRRAQINREQANRASKRISLDEIGRRLALGNFKELKLIVKGDVDGSVEALSDALIKLSVEKIQVVIIHKAVGPIAESDVLLASASDAIVIGFQVRPTTGARNLAEKEGVQVKLYSIIYEAIDEIKAAMEGMLEPTKEEKIIGQAEVREVYKITKVGTVAGCMVTEGKIMRNNPVRIIRDGIVVYPNREGATAEIASLKRFKDDAKEVKENMECGISIKNFNDLKVGDVIEAYEITEVRQKLE